METVENPKTLDYSLLLRVGIRFEFKRLVRCIGFKFSFHHDGLINWKKVRLEELNIKNDYSVMTFNRIRETFLDDFRDKTFLVDKIEEFEYYRSTLIILKHHVEFGILPTKFTNLFKRLEKWLNLYTDNHEKHYLDFEHLKF